MVIVDGKLIGWNEFAAMLGTKHYRCCNQYEFSLCVMTNQVICNVCYRPVPTILRNL